MKNNERSAFVSKLDSFARALENHMTHGPSASAAREVLVINFITSAASFVPRKSLVQV